METPSSGILYQLIDVKKTPELWSFVDKGGEVIGELVIDHPIDLLIDSGIVVLQFKHGYRHVFHISQLRRLETHAEVTEISKRKPVPYIQATCHHCGKQEWIEKSYAKKRTHCRTCGYYARKGVTL